MHGPMLAVAVAVAAHGTDDDVVSAGAGVAVLAGADSNPSLASALSDMRALAVLQPHAAFTLDPGVIRLDAGATVDVNVLAGSLSQSFALLGAAAAAGAFRLGDDDLHLIVDDEVSFAHLGGRVLDVDGVPLAAHAGAGARAGGSLLHPRNVVGARGALLLDEVALRWRYALAHERWHPSTVAEAGAILDTSRWLAPSATLAADGSEQRGDVELMFNLDELVGLPHLGILTLASAARRERAAAGRDGAEGADGALVAFAGAGFAYGGADLGDDDVLDADPHGLALRAWVGPALIEEAVDVVGEVRADVGALRASWSASLRRRALPSPLGGALIANEVAFAVDGGHLFELVGGFARDTAQGGDDWYARAVVEIEVWRALDIGDVDALDVRFVVRTLGDALWLDDAGVMRGVLLVGATL